MYKQPIMLCTNRLKFVHNKARCVYTTMAELCTNIGRGVYTTGQSFTH